MIASCRLKRRLFVPFPLLVIGMCQHIYYKLIKLNVYVRTSRELPSTLFFKFQSPSPFSEKPRRSVKASASVRNLDQFQSIPREGCGIVCSTMFNKNNFLRHLLILNHYYYLVMEKKRCAWKIQYFVLKRRGKSVHITEIKINSLFCQKCWPKCDEGRRAARPKKY